ncbi:RHS repeat domain-containing protein [Pseudoxanthomonas sp. UTMC 1351]|uniref:RHS repeat domain-containing protein n=1 Tax=Pseudoxanthomonas sp. UTMC 1351 TaxID=2695853 RepID=UPI0034CF6F41
MSRYLLRWLLGLLLVSGGPLAQAQTTVEYIHTDALGSPVAVTNQAGQVIERLDYEPYGAIIGQPNYGGIGFTGHVQDAATGLTYMQQRYYDPQCGCFLSVDPVTAYDKGDMRFFNRYAYAFNNPYKFTDPDGRQSRDFDSISREAGTYLKTPPPSPKDWLGPTIGGALAVVMAPVVAIAGWEVGMAALANPATTTAIVSEVGAAAGVTGTASTLKPGPFAGASMPARSSAQTFTTAERAAVNKIGQASGCHTCGTTNPGTKSGNFVPDHQPVSRLNSTNAPQQLYPQCLTCSKQQGLDVIKELRKKDP